MYSRMSLYIGSVKYLCRYMVRSLGSVIDEDKLE